MDTDNLVFLGVIEWFDKTGKKLVHRIPEKSSGEIKFKITEHSLYYLLFEKTSL